MLQRLAKAVIWPVRRFFDPRFAGVDDHVGIAHRELDENLADLRATEIAALREQLATRAAPEDLERALAPIRDELQTLRQTIEESRDAQALLVREGQDQAGDAGPGPGGAPRPPCWASRSRSCGPSSTSLPGRSSGSRGSRPTGRDRVRPAA